MALTTAKLGLPYPELTDPADAPHDIRLLAEAVDTKVPGIGQGTFAAIPAAGIAGRLYFATDRATLYYDQGGSVGWQPVSSMIGDLKFNVRAAEHQGWILANGRPLSAGQYPQLRALLVAEGSKFGVASGTSNPKLPDMRGRTPVGAGTNPAEGIAGNYTMGLKFGAELVGLAIANMPAHNHNGATGGDDRDHTHNYSDLGSGTRNNELHGLGVNFASTPSFTTRTTTGRSTGHLHAIASQGSGSAHENRGPMQVANWFIYAGPAA